MPRHLSFVLAILGLATLTGCPRPLGTSITTLDQVTDATGDNRLLLRDVALPSSDPDSQAYDWHSLVWEVRTGDGWTARLVISRADYQQGATRRRWVSKLHSLDPATGRAILKVGEEQPPDAVGTVHVEYSWREWDLLNNRQVRVIRVCGDPFEPLEGKQGNE